MAEKKTLKDYYKKIGSYKEFAGGGTPMEKGEKIDKVVDTPEEADAYKENNPDSIVRVRQPRDDEGKFTYNSANAKPLKYEQRPTTTIPPFLRDLKVTFAKKTGTMSFVIDGKRYVASQFKSVKEFVEAHKKYLGDEGFKDIGKVEDTVRNKGGLAVKDKDAVSVFDTEAFLAAYEKREGKKAGNKFAKKTGTGTDNVSTDTEQSSGDGSSGSKLDTNLAKSNPKQFKEKHRQELDSIAKMAEEAGYDFDVDILIDSIANGEVEDFESVKGFFK